MINSFFARPITSRIRVIVGSGISMVATDLASAKLSTMLASAKVATMQVGKMAISKIAVKMAALWVLLASFFVPLQQTAPVLFKHAIHRHHHHKVAPVVAPVVEEAPSNRLFLHSFEKEYMCVFTGKVTCGDEPCRAGNVQVHITSTKNPNIVKSAVVQPDGTYEVSVVVKELLHEHLDWWIIADSPDSASKQVQGREILMDDPNVRVEQPLNLL
jgi:hypothetical protein